MKYIYLSTHRLICYWLMMALVLLSTSAVLAQRKAEMESGVLRIKVSEALAAQLEQARFSRNASNVMVTGIQSIDRANVQFKVNELKRVFRPAGKFEDKHRKYGLHLWYEVKMDKAVSVLAALSGYQSIDQVQVAEPVYKKAIVGSDQKGFGPRRVEIPSAPLTLPGASNDPMLGNQWHYNNTGQAGGTPGSDISLFQAWGLETGSSNVIVAVTDGGAQVNHPDLAANMWVNVDEVPGNGIDDDGNGYVDDINGYGFGDDTGEIVPDDHGTHTSGTIAAVTNNGIGVAGVAGGSGTGDGVRIMSCAAFGGFGVGGFEDTYVYGADNGAVISQNSWGYTSAGFFEQVVLDAIDYFIAEAGKDEFGNQVGPMRGGIVIFAAGNNDSNEQHYPGFYSPTLAVSAVTNQDKKAWYSNFGNWVDIAAPGGETFFNNDPKGVLSTVSNGQYAYFQGTSMACPHVSGVAALIVSKFGGDGFTPEMLRGRLTQLVDDIDAADPPFAGLLGSGRLNAFAALQEDDGDAPEAIDDLAATHVGITFVTLGWTSPNDPGNGSASVYDIRYSTTPITNANFGSATAVPNPPVPLPAGSTETFTISGLLPETQYFFAIKSADFFGNFSTVSNIVEQYTNAAPVISVSPASLSASLFTAETTVEVFTIHNTGEGPLEFEITDAVADAFATASPASGNVPAGGSQVISVLFDASGLLTNVYTKEFEIVSNDPVTGLISFPVSLSVTNNGDPIASVSPDALDFGQVFETGSSSKPVVVHNAGSDNLEITGTSSDNSDFTTDFGSSIIVAPFEDATIVVTYTASSLGVSSGTISIATNDPANPTLSVAVTGEGVVAPDIEVSPSSLSASLNTDRTETQVLTLQNTGGSPLEFSIAISATAAATVVPAKSVVLPSSLQAQSAQGSKNTATASKYSQEVKLHAVKKYSATTSVLIITPDDDVNDMAVLLNAFDDVEATIFPGTSLPSITLADLAPYDIVFTTNNTQWLSSGGVSSEYIGDLLADYIDQGGKVIVNQFAYSYDGWKMDGRFITENYGPFTSSTTDVLTTVDLGSILDPGNPLVEGVSELTYSGWVQNVGLVPGATALATWSNGDLFLAANSNVVALNMLPSLGNGGPLQWLGDLPQIYINAIHYLGGASFVSVTPSEGIVAPGESLALDVTFDASGLEAGTYSASIDINNNAPNEELVSVPATLTVLGPEFTVSPTSLYDELEKGQTSTHTLVLSNNGPDDQTYTTSVTGGVTVSVKPIKTKPETAARKSSPASSQKKNNASGRKGFDIAGQHVVSGNKNASGRLAAPLASSNLYATDFEDLAIGDINGQDGWFGQYGNWTVEADEPFSGAQHFRGLSDGLGLSVAVSPAVGFGSEEKSTTAMKLNVSGSGVTWQIIPESPSAGFVLTRLMFNPDGSVMALVSNGAGGAIFQALSVPAPSGYFDLAIEADRATATFDVYFNDAKVFSGQGFAGNIEEVAVLSLMEVSGPTLDIDDFQIIDGIKEAAPDFVSVAPASGNLPSGASVELTVTFDAGDLDFDLYNANIKIAIGDVKELNVPASLRVVGDPAIDVDPTVLQAEVDYKQDTVKYFVIKNTGGRPLDFGMQVIGASTDMAAIQPGPVRKNAVNDRVREKMAKDQQSSKVKSARSSSVELFSGTALLEEHFEGASFPPTGWTVVDNEGTGLVWGFASDYGDGNYCGSGEAATVNSDAAGFVEFDTELITPSISTAGMKNFVVQYNVNYQNFANLDFLDLDIQVDGGAWTTVLSWNEDHGTLFDLPGEVVSVALDSYISGGSSFKLRWHYYDPNDGDWDWYAQVDDVVVLAEARAWLAVSPATGTIPVGEEAFIEARFDAEDVDPGFYVAGILVSSNAPADPLVGVVASLTVREPAEISVDPASLYQELLVGESATQTLTITNSGPSILKYAFGNAPLPASSGVGLARREPLEKRQTPVMESIHPMDTRAIRSGVGQHASVIQYGTGFEDFAPGDINGQDGWVGQWGNWTIESFNAHEGSQHFRGLSDGLGLSLAFSPNVAIGTDPISSTVMMLDVAGSGVTWQIIPQSPTNGFVNTRFNIAPDGSLSALVQDDVGNGFYQPIAATLPEGYVEVRIEVERATSQFTIFIDGNSVFSGKGFAGDIEQVVIYSQMENFGPTFDIDNLTILDGPGVTPWLSVNPKAGYVFPGSSATIEVSFNAKDLAAGYYTDTLKIFSNDPLDPLVLVPATLFVDVNLPPVLTLQDTSVVERSDLNVTFTATDPDDATVVITAEVPDFMVLTSSGNGTATFAIGPEIGDAGHYEIPVTATDSRGGSVTEIFNLEVLSYGVQNFSLIYFQTGAVVETFEDSVVLDVADPDIEKYTIQANTIPTSVGSVRFRLDGSNANTDNYAPYTINHWQLPVLGKGDHTITAQAFTRTNARGEAGALKTGIIQMTNSAEVTDFDLVDRYGNKLMDLVDGSVIDINQPGFGQINIFANTSISTVRSVRFVLNNNTARIDNLAPFAIKGNANGSDTYYTPRTGTWVLTATPYMSYYGWGVPGVPLTITFTVVKGTAPTMADAGARSGSGEWEETSVNEGSVLTLYPVPVSDELHLNLEGFEGKVALMIHNAQGRSMHTDEGEAEKFREYSISTSKLGMISGIYFVQVRGANGKRIVQKFVKL